jgi:transposase-like protein
MVSDEFLVRPRETKQHKFTPAERLQLLEIWDQQLDHGSKSAWCRRMGISPTTAARWNRERREGILVVDPERETKYVLAKRERHEFARLQRENADLIDRLAQAESAVEVLGKASELLAALAKSSSLRKMSESASGAAPVPETFRGTKPAGSDTTPSQH